MIDTCLDIWHTNEFPVGNLIGFAEIDWVYCLTRARAQCGHRWQDVQDALVAMTNRYIPFLLQHDPATDPGLNDLHRLFGVCCALAELQRALPGYLHTDRPLQLVLDRRPFI